MKPAPTTIQQFVAEWFIEDQDRYERLAMRRPPGGLVRTMSRGRAVTTPEPLTLISCVLSVPLPRTDEVTTILRSHCEAGSSRYLQRAAEAAEQLSGAATHALELELYVAKLEGMVRDLASRIGSGISNSFETTMRMARVSATLERSRVNDALLERSAEVAAKLLAAIPDDGT